MDLINRFKKCFEQGVIPSETLVVEAYKYVRSYERIAKPLRRVLQNVHKLQKETRRAKEERFNVFVIESNLWGRKEGRNFI